MLSRRKFRECYRNVRGLRFSKVCDSQTCPARDHPQRNHEILFTNLCDAKAVAKYCAEHRLYITTLVEARRKVQALGA